MSEFVSRLIAENGYLGVGLLMFLETIFPPIPSEVIMALAGLQVAKGEMSLVGVVAVGTAGAMAGNIVWYALARAIGVDRFRPLVRRWGRWLTLSLADIDKGHSWFDTYGGPFVMFARMLPTLRSLVSVPAGLVAMNFRTFAIYSAFGTAGWTALLAFAGMKLGQNYAEVEAFIGPVSTAIVVTLAAGYVWRVITWKYEH